MKIKEFGSDFHYLSNADFRLNYSEAGGMEKFQTLCFSGRVAFYLILLKGIEKYSLKKVYVPSYYCHEVYDFVQELNIELIHYQVNPINGDFSLDIEDRADTALLLVDYFGVSKAAIPTYQYVKVIEDLTHCIHRVDESNADFVFGSLRKCLPLPVGGFINSKESFDFGVANSFTEQIVMHKLTGMYLKQLYLNGEHEHKTLFRSLLIDSEEKLGDSKTIVELSPLVLEMFKSLAVDSILEQKKSNLTLIKSIVRSNNIFKLVTSDSNTDFACILYFNNQADRDAMKGVLINNQIYPMVLWPHQKNNLDIEVENNILFIHVDYRYDNEDIAFIGNKINQFLEVHGEL